MKTLIIIPCYNEGESIAAVVRSIEHQYDYVIVNDGSRDDSLAVIRAHGFHCLDLPNNLGIGAAMQAGYRYAYRHGYDVAVQMDGDGQHEPAGIPSLLAPLERDEADLVIGSRFVSENNTFRSSQMRRFGIRLLSSLMKRLSGTEIRDMTSGFRAANRTVIALFARSYPQEYPEPVTNLMLAHLGFRLKETAVAMKAREHGISSIGRLKSAYYMFNVILQFLIVRISAKERSF